MHDARNHSGHMHDAQALAMHDARNEKNAMHVHTMCKNPMIGARKKGMGTLCSLGLRALRSRNFSKKKCASIDSKCSETHRNAKKNLPL